MQDNRRYIITMAVLLVFIAFSILILVPKYLSP